MKANQNTYICGSKSLRANNKALNMWLELRVTLGVQRPLGALLDFFKNGPSSFFRAQKKDQ